MVLPKFFLSNRSFFVLAILIVLSVLYYRQLAFQLPNGIHAWAQADRYALATNFYDQGMNFFLPSTNNVYPKSGITGVEFPLQSYLAALFAKVIGRDYISVIFRLLTLAFSITALLVIFRWVYLRSHNFWISLFPPVFCFSSPVFIYYSYNYLPDTASASIMVIAFYFLYKYYKEDDTRDANYAIIIAALGTLLKTSSGIYYALIILNLVVIFFVRRKSTGWKKIVRTGIAITLSGIVIVSWFLYIRYLDEKYKSSVFLAQAKPLGLSWKEICESTRITVQNWMADYFTPVQQWIIVVAGILFLLRLVFFRRRYLFFYFNILAGGIVALAGYIIMGAQFPVHDYYVIAIFFPVIMLLIIFSTIVIADLPRWKMFIIMSPFSLLLMLVMVVEAYNKSTERFSYHIDDFWAPHLKADLGRIGVMQSDKVLISGDNAPNLGLVYADKHGMNVKLSDHYQDVPYVVRFMRDYGLRYLTVNPTEYDSLMQMDSCSLKLMKLVSRNSESVILKYNGTLEDQLWHPLKPQNDSVHLVYMTSFEFPDSCRTASRYAHSGLYSFPLSKDNPFMSSLLMSSADPGFIVAKKIKASFWIRAQDGMQGLKFVMDSYLKEGEKKNKEVDLSSFQFYGGEWKQVTVSTEMPENNLRTGHLMIYLWNSGKEEIYVDDFLIQLE